MSKIVLLYVLFEELYDFWAYIFFRSLIHFEFIFIYGMCQEAFNKRLPVCCFRSVRNPLALINS